MIKLEDFITELKEYNEVDEQRQAIFYFVRDIPYSTINCHTMADALKNNRADCFAKATLLSYLFQTFGYKTRILVVRYRLKNYPAEVRFIPGQIDYHYALEICLQDKWVMIDATYDPPRH